MDYVIIGNSVAAVGAIEAIRQQDNKNKITVISDEPYSVYSRPLISYLLAGKIKKDRMYYRDKTFYRNHKVETILDKKVTAVDAKKKEITLFGKEKIVFDKLLIATGGNPIVPRIEGQELEGAFTFTKWDDAKKIKEFIKGNKVEKVVVIGGGLIGLKATEAFMELGIEVTIVELADRVLSAAFDKKASEIIEGCLKKKKTNIITKNTVEKIKGKNGKINSVILKSGDVVDCQSVIFAIGVVPNIDIVKGTGIKVNRGVLVDHNMQTNIPDIYAAGDVTEAFDMILGINRPIAIWPNAYRQGRVAGFNMAGLSKECSGGFAMNSVEICGVSTVSVGITASDEEGYEILKVCKPKLPSYKKIVLQDDVIIGAIFIGDIDRSGIITGLIKDKIDISSFKEHLMKEDFGLLSLPKEYRKHIVSGMGIEI